MLRLFLQTVGDSSRLSSAETVQSFQQPFDPQFRLPFQPSTVDCLLSTALPRVAEHGSRIASHESLDA